MVFTWLQLAIIIFLLSAVAFAVGPLIASVFLSPKARGGDLGTPYECGMPPHGESWIRFGVSYYVYGILFIAFEVDVLYLFPVAIWYPKSEGWGAFWVVFIFLAILAAACLYFFRKGVFSWPRRI
jgi:NADH:ubiquinone oxidoreductase subunit 3 (subunit A)